MAKKKSRLSQALRSSQINQIKLDKQKKTKNKDQDDHQIKKDLNQTKIRSISKKTKQNHPEIVKTDLNRKKDRVQVQVEKLNQTDQEPCSTQLDRDHLQGYYSSSTTKINEHGQIENDQPIKPAGKSKLRNKNKTQVSNCDRCMVKPGEKILLIGEGNFSFTVSLILNHSIPAKFITSTTNETKQKILEKYPDSNKNIKILESLSINLLFECDGTKLDKDKRIKSLIRERDQKFDKVIFNFPNLGCCESDMNRNIRLNQILILRFLRSVTHVLYEPSDSGSDDLYNRANLQKKKKRKFDDDDSEEDDQTEDEGDELGGVKRGPGSVLITLGTQPPYSLWELPMLAKRGETLSHSILYPTHPNLRSTPQPNYQINSSFEFKSEIYPHYSHRRTIGIKSKKEYLSLLKSNQSISEIDDDVDDHQVLEVENTLPKNPRTWEFQLIRNYQ